MVALKQSAEAKMAYTVKALAKLSGVSVRTLHFYDEIGLLKPAYYGSNKYRYYEEEQLLMLQQILFYRELGFRLIEIQRIVGSDDFNKLDALNSHKLVLKRSLDRTQKLIKTVNKTIAYLRGTAKMREDEMYYGFDKNKQDEYEHYLVEKKGKTAEALINESKERTKSWEKDDYDRMRKEFETLHHAFAEAIVKGLSPNAPDVQLLVRKHYEIILRFYTPTKEVYISLGQLYFEHPDFRKLYDSIHPELAKFLMDSMKIFAENELS